MTIAEVAETTLVIGNPTCFDKHSVYVKGLRWPNQDAEIDRVDINHILEYLPGPDRVWFINELWRVMKPDAKATLHLPYWSSMNAYADPYLEWPPISEMSIQYLSSADFRARNQLVYPELTANFLVNWGYSFAPEWHVRSDATRDAAVKNYVSVVTSMVCTLTKIDA